MRIVIVNRTHYNNTGQETLDTNCDWNGNYTLLCMHDVDLEVILWIICAQVYYFWIISEGCSDPFEWNRACGSNTVNDLCTVVLFGIISEGYSDSFE